MSGRALHWTLGHSETENSLRLVLVALAHAASEEGSGRIRPRSLAKLTRIEEGSVVKAVDLLAARGEIEAEKCDPRRRSFAYRVKIPAGYGYFRS